MILVEADVSGEWDSRTDWPALAEKSVRAAVAHSRHAGLIDGEAEISVKFTDDEEVRGLFARRGPLTVIRAETGLMATPPPLVDERFVIEFPHHDWRFVPGSNHYSIMFSDNGAAEVAQALLDAVAATA